MAFAFQLQQPAGDWTEQSLLALFFRLLEERLDRPRQLDCQRIAVTIPSVANRHSDPAFADAVFINVVPLGAPEADANAPLKHGRIEIGALRVDGQTV